MKPVSNVVSLPRPHSLDAERALLGMLMLDPDRLRGIVDHIAVDDLYDARHREILKLMLRMSDEGAPTSMETVCLHMERESIEDKCGGMLYVSRLSDSAPASDAVPYFAAKLRDLAERRRLIRQATSAAQRVADGDDLEEVRAALVDHGSKAGPSKVEHISPVMQRVIDDVADRMERARAGRRPGILHGLVDVERAAPLECGHLVLLAARPGMGKTALALNIGMGAASNGHGVAVIELEMTSVDLGLRLACSAAGTTASVARDGQLNDAAYSELAYAASQLADLPIWVDDTPALTVEQIEARVRALKSRHPELQLVVVDHIGLCGATDKSAQRTRQVGHISNRLKCLAKAEDVCVLALSQLNREVEKRPNKRPRLADLRDSGEIEQDADMVLMLYRDDYYNEGMSTEPGVAELSVAKARHGRTGVTRLAWHGPTTTFSSLEQRYDGYGGRR